MPTVKKSLGCKLNKIIHDPNTPCTVALRAIHMRGYLAGLFPAKLMTKGALPNEPTVELTPNPDADLSSLIKELDGGEADQSTTL